MTNEELVLLQNTQYQILVETINLCEKYNIKYYLAYGTLLGAVRHGGSIPWDSDIDIFMDRQNHDKFIKVANELPVIYEVGMVGESKYNGLSRVYKKNTLIYSEEHGKKDAFPIHIDIFVLEYAKKRSKCMQKIVDTLTRYLIIAKLNKYEKGWLYKRFENNKIKLLIVRSGEIVRSFASEETIEKWIYGMLVSQNREAQYVNIQDLRKRFPVSYFGNGIMLKYEARNFVSPQMYDQLLKLCYGNYMEFPPLNKRYTAEMDSLIIIF